MKKALICLGMTAAYWALTLLGPMLVMLINTLGYYVNGGGWKPGSLAHNILLLFSQPISCFIAYFAAESAGKWKLKACTLTNCIVAGCAFIWFTIIAPDRSQATSMVLSVVACTITAVICAVSKRETRKDAQSSCLD